MRRALFYLGLLAVCVLAFAARCWNWRDVFIEGQIYFVDADCYARMTRVALIDEGGPLVVRHHAFENWPNGIAPHTTAPLDWLILAGRHLLDSTFFLFDRRGSSLLRTQTLDLSGALISPICAVLICAFLGWWMRQNGPPKTALIAPLLFAISPIAVHGTVLGRPDHQSLLLLLLTIALAAELSLSRQLSRGWSLVAGGSWALAIWVSAYEPLVLFVGIAALWVCFRRARFGAREMRAGWVLFGSVLGVALFLEHWRLVWPDAALRHFFANWQQSIGELTHVDPREPLLYRWLTYALLPAPVLLYFAGRNDRRAWLLGGLLALTFGLTIWQARWGYFLALAFTFALPWMAAAFSRRWIAWVLLIPAAWPLAQDWDERLNPDFSEEKEIASHRRELVLLRRFANAIWSPEPTPFLAPWWISPALAYWSRQPGVAGSSHESLPGIVDSARFFLAESPAAGAAILQAHGVAWVLADDAERTISTSATLLGVPPPAAPLAKVLADQPLQAPAFLREEKFPPLRPAPGQIPAGVTQTAEPAFYHLYRVEGAMLPP